MGGLKPDLCLESHNNLVSALTYIVSDGRNQLPSVSGHWLKPDYA